MDDIKIAAKRRFERAVKNASWDARVQGDPSNTVAFWLYSVNPNEGARFITQLSVEGYRAACDPAGLMRVPGIAPADVLGGFLNEYDKIEDMALRLDKHKDLASALLCYASSTKTWEMLPKPGEVPGIHMVIADWPTVSSGRIFRPLVKIGQSILSPQALGEAFEYLLAFHLSKHPKETPVLT